MNLKKIILLIMLVFFQKNAAQDSLKLVSKQPKFKFVNVIIPATLLASGLVLRDADLKKEVYNFQRNAIGDRFVFKYDDFIQNTPSVLAIFGKSLHQNSANSTAQITTNHLVSILISGIITRSVKIAVNDKRPVLYGVRSFPSGHTTTAFNGATLLFLEYKDSNLWYASSGYLLATTTAFFRLSNNKHWLADVCAGAGIGMATAFVVQHWNPDIYKHVKKLVGSSKNISSFMAFPIMENNTFGLGLHLNFK